MFDPILCTVFYFIELNEQTIYLDDIILYKHLRNSLSKISLNDLPL